MDWSSAPAQSEKLLSELCQGKQSCSSKQGQTTQVWQAHPQSLANSVQGVRPVTNNSNSVWQDYMVWQCWDPVSCSEPLWKDPVSAISALNKPNGSYCNGILIPKTPEQGRSATSPMYLLEIGKQMTFCLVSTKEEQYTANWTHQFWIKEEKQNLRRQDGGMDGRTDGQTSGIYGFMTMSVKHTLWMAIQHCPLKQNQKTKSKICIIRVLSLALCKIFSVIPSEVYVKLTRQESFPVLP